MQQTNGQPPIDTNLSIGDESEERLAERICAELVNDPEVMLIATCPANGPGHLAAAIGPRIRDLVTDWMVEHLDRTGDTRTYVQRGARWLPGSDSVEHLIAEVVNTLHARHADKRRRPDRNERAA